MLLLVKAKDKTYGGYRYIEIDYKNGLYSTGHSSAHQGHGFAAMSDNISEEVFTTPTELRNLKAKYERLEESGYIKKVSNMWAYHNELMSKREDL